MNYNIRSLVLQWRSEELISAQDLESALQVTGCEPTAPEWQNFLKQVFLWFGSIGLSTGVIFFFAYNWQEISRFSKFALVEGTLLSATFLFYRLASKRNIATVTLMAMALFTGALLALVGQTYQTGADPWQLFAVWAIFVTPWAVAANAISLWILWILLVNLAFILYLNISTSIFGFLINNEVIARLLVAINTLLLVAFESYKYFFAKQNTRNENHDRNTIQYKRVIQVLILLAGMAVFLIAFSAIFSSKPSISDLVFYAVWMTLIYLYYRYRSPDLFIIASGALSVGAIFISVLINGIGSSFDEGAFLLVSFSIIGLSTAAGIWLKKLAKEFHQLRPLSHPTFSTSTTDIDMGSKEVELTEETLWDQLKQSNIVTGEQPEAAETISTWYIKAMQGFGGWVAGFFLLGFVGAFLSSFFNSGNWLLLVIFAFMSNGLSFLLSKASNKNEFLQQLALIFNLTGQLLFVWGLYELLESWGAGFFFLVFIYQSVIVYIISDYSSRLMTSSFALFALFATFEQLGLTNLSMLFTALVFVFIWIKDDQWGTMIKLWAPIAYGVSISLLIIHGQNAFDPLFDWLNGSIGNSKLTIASYWLGETGLAALFIYLVVVIARKYKVVLATSTGILLFIGLLLTLTINAVIPGISAALLLLLVGFMRQRRILLGLGIIAFISFIGWYYYSLDITLLAKSMTLVGFGISFIAAFILITKISISPIREESTELDGKNLAQVQSGISDKGKWLVIGVTLLILILINSNIYQKERILETGKIVLLKLAPVDPRSLMQGDYMRLRFEIETTLLDAVQNNDTRKLMNSGIFVVSTDKNSIASEPKLYQNEELKSDQVVMQFRLRRNRVQLATHAFFFQEGTAKEYESAKYGEFRVAENGELLLNNLRDKNFSVLGYNRPSN